MELLSHTKSLLHIFANKKYDDKNSIKINWRDPSLKIKWPTNKNNKIIISESHQKLQIFKGALGSHN